MLLPDPSRLELQHYAADKQLITMVVKTTPTMAPCPTCQSPSGRVHSRYRRTLADLPWQGIQVRLLLHTRKFFCSQSTCPVAVFTERLPTVTEPYARQTGRLGQAVLQLGLALGGAAGARLALRLGLKVSRDSLLRTVRRAGQTNAVWPRVLGVDDWAWRRGQHYGTLLVDLEGHRPADLLPDRRAESLAEWLKEHARVEIICRDRAGAYAEGARQGAPQAIQVADRWHLLKNLREALEQLVARKHRLVRQAAQAMGTQPKASDDVETPPSSRPVDETQLALRRQQRRERRKSRYEQVLELFRKGASIRAIAEHLGMHRRTVRRFVRSDGFPERASPKRCPSTLDSYHSYLEQRWQEGCHNAAKLWRELRQQGYRGSQSMLRKHLAGWRTCLPALGQTTGSLMAGGSAVRFTTPSPGRTSWLLLEPPENCQAEESAFVEQLSSLSPEIKTAKTLAEDFYQMMRHRQADRLDQWLTEAAGSGLPELASFAAGLQKDKPAVIAGLTLEWSNGQVEGQVHRLKLLKRQMYGRAKLDLLRARVLLAA